MEDCDNWMDIFVILGMHPECYSCQYGCILDYIDWYSPEKVIFDSEDKSLHYCRLHGLRLKRHDNYQEAMEHANSKQLDKSYDHGVSHECLYSLGRCIDCDEREASGY